MNTNRKNLKFLLITNIFPPKSGGAASNYNFFMESLSKNKTCKQVIILTSYEKTKPFLEKLSDNKVIIFRLLSYKLFKNKLIKLIVCFFHFFQNIIFAIYLKTVKIDIVQIHSDSLFFLNGKFLNYSVLFFKKISKKTILDIRDKQSIPKKDIGFDQYLANSHNIYTLLTSKIKKSKVCLIYSPLTFYTKKQLNEHSVKYNKYKPYLCFLGNLTTNKGFFNLVNAIKILNSDNTLKNHKLLIGGNSNFVNLDFPKNIHYMGELKHISAMSMLSNAELLVLPSLSESLPRVCIEAFSYNVPVLTTRGVYEFDSILDSSFFIDNHDPSHIAEKIRKLLFLDRKIIKYPISLHNKDSINRKLGKIYKL